MTLDYDHFIVPRDRAFCPGTAEVAALVEALRRDRWVPSEAHVAKWEKPPRPPQAKFAVLAPPPAHEDPNVFVVDPRIPPRRPVVRPRQQEIPTPLDATFLDAHVLRDPVHASGSDYLLWFPVWPPEADGGYPAADLRYPFTEGEDDTFHNSHVIEIIAAGDFVVPFTNSFGATEARCPCGAELFYEPEGSGVVSPVDCTKRIHRACPRCNAPARPSAFSTEVIDPWTHEPRVLAGSVAYRFALHIGCDQNFPDGEFHLSSDLADLVAATLGQPVVDFGGLT